MSLSVSNVSNFWRCPVLAKRPLDFLVLLHSANRALVLFSYAGSPGEGVTKLGMGLTCESYNKVTVVEQNTGKGRGYTS